MDRDGMNRGSAINHLKRSATVKFMMVLPSSAIRLDHLEIQLSLSFSSVSSTAVLQSSTAVLKSSTAVLKSSTAVLVLIESALTSLLVSL